jgi:hypothetical protein
VVGDAALIRQITAPDALADGTPVNYGFALWRWRFAGHDVVMHTGSHAGYHLIFAYFPTEDMAIAIFSNVNVNRFNLLEAVADIYLNGGVGKATQSPPAIAPKAALIQAAVGHYMDPMGHMITLEIKDQRLVWNGAPVVFRSDGSMDTDDELFFGYGVSRLQTDTAGHVNAIQNEIEFLGPRRVVFARIEQVQPNLSYLSELTGDYRSPELDTTFHFTVENGLLVARSLWIVEPIVFTPTVMDSFDSSLGAIVFQRDPAGHPIGMMLNAGDASHVALVKITSGCTD